MNHLKNQDKSAIRAALEQERQRLQSALRAAQEESGQTQYAELLGRASGDSSDEALAVTLGDISAARMDHEVRALQALEAALGRIDDKDFGQCDECGAAIPVARLIINPAATRCVACQDRHEHAGQVHRSH